MDDGIASDIEINEIIENDENKINHKSGEYCDGTNRDVARMQKILDKLSTEEREKEIEESLFAAIDNGHTYCLELFSSYPEFKLNLDLKIHYIWTRYWLYGLDGEQENIDFNNKFIKQYFTQDDINKFLESLIWDDKTKEYFFGSLRGIQNFDNIVILELENLGFDIYSFLLPAIEKYKIIPIDLVLYLGQLKTVLLNGYGFNSKVFNDSNNFYISLTDELLHNHINNTKCFKLYSIIFYELKECGIKGIFNKDYLKSINEVINLYEGMTQHNDAINSLKIFKKQFIDLKSKPLSLQSCVRSSLIKQYNVKYVEVITKIRNILPDPIIDFLLGIDLEY